jgi:hypothetical protein
LQQGHAAITGNVCTGNGVAGIGVTNSLNPSHTTSTIAGNSLQDNYRGFQLDTCQNLLISGNVVTGSTDYGVLANNSANRVAFVGNVIANGQRHGLVIQGVEDWTITGNLFVDNGQALTSRYGVSVEDMTGRVNCKRILIAGNTSHNSGTNTTQTHGFVISGTGDKITLVGNATGNGTTVDYSIGASITDVATWSNTGATTNSATIPWTSYTMASGATIGSTPTGGFTIGANAAQKLSFYGKTPVVQAPAVTAAPTQSATYVQTDVQSIATALNAVITALRNIGITA